MLNNNRKSDPKLKNIWNYSSLGERFATLAEMQCRSMPDQMEHHTKSCIKKQSISPGINPKLIGFRTKGKSSMQDPIPFNQTRNRNTLPCMRMRSNKDKFKELKVGNSTQEYGNPFHRFNIERKVRSIRETYYRSLPNWTKQDRRPFVDRIQQNIRQNYVQYLSDTICLTITGNQTLN